MTNTNYLAHHGIEGQKWGVRRYQNEDGSLTEEGRKRYGYSAQMRSTKQNFKNASAENAKTQRAYLQTRFSSADLDSVNSAKAAMNKAKSDLSEAKREYKQNKDIKNVEQTIWKEQRKEYIQSKSIGEKALTGLFLGPAGLYNYNSLMSRNPNGSKGVAFGASLVTGLLTGGLGNIVASTVIANKVKENY